MPRDARRPPRSQSPVLGSKLPAAADVAARMVTTRNAVRIVVRPALLNVATTPAAMEPATAKSYAALRRWSGARQLGNAAPKARGVATHWGVFPWEQTSVASMRNARMGRFAISRAFPVSALRDSFSVEIPASKAIAATPARALRVKSATMVHAASLRLARPQCRTACSAVVRSAMDVAARSIARVQTDGSARR